MKLGCIYCRDFVPLTDKWQECD